MRKNSKFFFWGGGGGNNNNGKKRKVKIQKIICREGFVEILHFEGGRILPSVGKGRVAFWGEAEPGEGCTLNMRGRKYDSFPVWGRLAFIFGEESFTPSPLRIILVLILGEESLGVAMHLEVKRLTSSPCEEGFTGKDSCAFKEKKP